MLVAHRLQGETGLAVKRVARAKLLRSPLSPLSKAVGTGHSLGRQAGDGPSCSETACSPASTAQRVQDKYGLKRKAT